MLFDNHGRQLEYLRLAVTDRCNLRCHYCMPEKGLDWLGRAELLSYEELLRLVGLLCKMGIRKVRITGGEPFARRDLIGFLEKLARIDGLERISVTTNGVGTAPFLPILKRLGIRSINLSLDSLDRERFFQITRRDELPRVLETFHGLLDQDFDVKINAVALGKTNEMDFIPLAELAEKWPVDIRFIEEMPFNGSGQNSEKEVENAPFWDHRRLLEHLQTRWPDLEKTTDPPFSTSKNYRSESMLGRVGIIAAWSRTFCGSCNRIRLTPQGALKTCLYDAGVLQARDLLRSGASDDEITERLLFAFQNRAKNGHEAEKARAAQPIGESMATIGG